MKITIKPKQIYEIEWGAGVTKVRIDRVTKRDVYFTVPLFNKLWFLGGYQTSEPLVWFAEKIVEGQRIREEIELPEVTIEL